MSIFFIFLIMTWFRMMLSDFAVEYMSNVKDKPVKQWATAEILVHNILRFY